MDTLPLFAEPPRPGVSPAKTVTRSPNPVWSKYTGQRVACDECVILLHENHGVGALPRSARLVCTMRAAGVRLRLCTEHAALQRGPRP
jgi:hypothetical protein